MSSITDEAQANQDTFLDAALRAGIEALSYVQQVTFTQYRRVVLPLDGFVFWVRADLLTPNAFNKAPYNTTMLDQSFIDKAPAVSIEVKGSLHYATDQHQEETEVQAVNRVVFTSEQDIHDFNAVGPSLMYIGEFEGMRFAFSNRGSFYRQADIFHYVGNAIYPNMASQIIDNPRLFRNRLIVSNSLPIWLSMSEYQPEPWEVFSNNFPVFPSFLSEQNIVPPFMTVHIEPSLTNAFSSAPSLDRTYSHTQLCKDSVRVVMNGLDNDNALSFIDFVNQFSLNTDLIGIMNIPTIRDEKKTQPEFGILAMRKAVEFEVSYYQSVARDIARQLIKEVIVNYEFGN